MCVCVGGGGGGGGNTQHYWRWHNIPLAGQQWHTPHVLFDISSTSTQHMTHWLLTDVNDVAMFVHHDVAIVSVFDLQQVTDQRVGSHALDKVGPGL